MMDYKSIIHLKDDLGMSARKIAEKIGESKTTVCEFLTRRATNPDLFNGKDVGLMTNDQIYELLYKSRGRSAEDEAENFRQVDCEGISRKLKEKGQTLKRLWRLYNAEGVIDGKKPYSYRQFCQKVHDWKNEQISVSHIERNPGENMELDFAGKTLYILVPGTGEKIKVTIFVATLSYSGYFYAEGLTDLCTNNWIKACNNALSYFKGVTTIVTVDNTKQAVIENKDWIDPVKNEHFQDWASYYGTVILPARVKAPTWKPKVERSVGILTNDIITEMEEMTFFSLESLNSELFKRVDERNGDNYYDLDFSRRDLYENEEKNSLLQLPSLLFEIYERKCCKVRRELCLDFDKVHYTMQRKYVGKTMLVKASSTRILIYDEKGFNLIKEYPRSYTPHSWVWDNETEPKTKTDYGKWSPEYFINWASKIGENTEDAIRAVLGSKKYPNQTFRSCFGILVFAKKYGDETLEACCKEALSRGKCNYSYIKNTIDSFVDDTFEAAGYSGKTQPQPMQFKADDNSFSIENILKRQEAKKNDKD